MNTIYPILESVGEIIKPMRKICHKFVALIIINRVSEFVVDDG